VKNPFKRYATIFDRLADSFRIRTFSPKDEVKDVVEIGFVEALGIYLHHITRDLIRQGHSVMSVVGKVKAARSDGWEDDIAAMINEYTSRSTVTYQRYPAGVMSIGIPQQTYRLKLVRTVKKPASDFAGDMTRGKVELSEQVLTTIKNYSSD
jgi:hypothetical protein